jgi:3-hydroxyisobutyrate dehydrogenase
MRIGFIGLGNVGRPLAANLLRSGFDLMVLDLDRARAEPLLGRGAVWGEDPASIAAACNVVITSLPSPAAVRAVMERADGVLANLRAGSAWIEMSTTDGAEVRRLAEQAATADIQVLEAPVTGGCHRAEAGDITILVGGVVDTFDRMQPVLRAMGEQVIHIGPLGSASVVKVITNMLAFAHLVALGEAYMLGRRAGVDLATLHRAIAASSGNSFVHETEGQLILNGSYDIGFTMELAQKDLGLARALGREHGVPLELADLVRATFDRATAAYGARAWSPRVVQLLEDALDTDLRAPGFPARLEG